MLFDRPTMDAVAAGSVTVAFRRWKRPSVRAGGTQTTAMGVLAIDDVRVITPDEITDGDAVRAGSASREALLAELARRDGELYRIEFHVAGPDPRIELRQRDELTAEEVDEIGRRLTRLDTASAHGPWTNTVLELIAARPAVRAGDLADELGRERLAFKTDVRKLKALGLTESLAVGYRLSPRGQAWLRRS
ncbi:MAG: hypothetical protein ABW195_19450 [Ilumatobacteraceae bacterium]